jgi:hypothetical protein
MTRLSIITVSLTLLASPITAEEMDCKAWHGLAETIMGARQEGVALPKMMETANSGVPAVDEAAKKLLLMAYEQPHYSTPENQKRAIEDFANQVSLECYKAKGKK